MTIAGVIQLIDNLQREIEKQNEIIEIVAKQRNESDDIKRELRKENKALRKLVKRLLKQTAEE